MSLILCVRTLSCGQVVSTLVAYNAVKAERVSIRNSLISSHLILRRPLPTHHTTRRFTLGGRYCTQCDSNPALIHPYILPVANPVCSNPLSLSCATGQHTWSGITGLKLRECCARLSGMSTTFHINIDGSIGGRTRVQPGSTGGGGGGGGGSRSASPRRGSFVRSASGTQALLEQLPPFVRKWYVRYIANGRKRWSAEEVLELEGAPAKVIQRLTGATALAAAHPHHHQTTGHQEQQHQHQREALR